MGWRDADKASSKPPDVAVGSSGYCREALPEIKPIALNLHAIGHDMARVFASRDRAVIQPAGIVLALGSDLGGAK